MTLDDLRAALHRAVQDAKVTKLVHTEDSDQYRVAMEEVEELSAALHDRKQNTSPVDLEVYCKDHPSNPECKIYDV